MTKRIVLTGGGTAGHVTPNIALIPHLLQDGFEVHYIGTDGMERNLIASIPHVTYHTIESGKFRRYFSLKNLSDPFRVIKGINQAREIIREIKPDVVFSKGGYVSVPVVIAARGIAPVIAHESDFSPGLATKISAKYADVICTTFDDTRKSLGSKAVYTGTPIRPTLFQGNAEAGLEFMGFTGSKPVIMVMGGSLGALALNIAVRDALDTLLQNYNIVHICGKDKVDDSIQREGYTQFEYVSDQLPHVFAAASIVISRAGANSIFEYLALRKPSILVPLPAKTSRGDQVLNAEYFKSKGYSVVMPQDTITSELLIANVQNVMAHRADYVHAMEQDSIALSGTQNVLDIIYKKAGITNA